MRGYLTKETRLQINITRLKNGTKRLQEKVIELTRSNKEKDRKIAALEARLQDKEAQRKELLSYLYKPGKKSEESKPRGKKPGSLAYHRPIPMESAVTQEYTYTLKQCPICKNTVGHVVDTVVKYTEDIALKPRPLVTKHTITRHWCTHCETYVKSPDVPPITRIGIKTMGYVLYARYRLRLPMEKIQESLHDLYDFKLSQGEIVAMLKDSELLFGKDYQAINVLIQEAKAVYADETGWRMDGKNWWLWVFTTTTGTQYVIEDTQGKGVPENVLGEKQDRVIISDGYAAYQNLPGDKQQCWVHLLRAGKLHSPLLYEDLVMLYKKLLCELEKPLEQREKRILEKRFAELIEKNYPEPTVEKIKARMRRHQSVLFTCLNYDGVLPENNTAERAIRPQVVMRKIFGGTRSLAGTT
ncbi:MAG: IS66 family transposase, partial [Candidatus Sungbacteria bacterium]|nr:IS66 family transposase [Candidatus Sungbacteria bacterium]